ncbi:hypothetical protein RR46_07442 [Papilio xuthus]|uniref:Uncharacterized protein n=1 Tax=Papilio xuthus TaxID=66420 RepID=A0A194Q2R1_PAPXU|nr:hypothetical protein RR46_07442 [Papilio xuthus]
MKRQLIILLAAVTFTVAMVPKLRNQTAYYYGLRKARAPVCAPNLFLNILRSHTKPNFKNMLVNDPVFVEGALLPVYCRLPRDVHHFAIPMSPL